MFKNKPMSKLLVNRRVWVIRDLLDNPLRQKDIIELWVRRGEVQYEEYEKMRLNGKGVMVDVPNGYEYSASKDEEIWKPKKLKDGIGISKGSLSKIFNGDYKNHHTGLIDEDIVKITLIDGKIGYRLVENDEALYKIMIEFNNPILPETFKIQIRKYLMNSKYTKKIVNKDLVKNIGFVNDSALNTEEINFVFAIIKISPSALLTVLKKLHDQRGSWIELNPENEKNNFLMDLQFKTYNDVVNQKITDKLAYYPIPVQVEFKIETSIKIGKKEFPYASNLKNSSLECLSEEEQEEEIKKIENKFIGDYEKEKEELLKPLRELIDVPFDLKSSPLAYEKKI